MMGRGWAPYAVLGVGVAAVSWAAILIREAEAPALIIASYRLTLAALPMGTLAIVQQRRQPEPVSASAVAPLFLSAVFLAAHFGFWVTSVQRTSVVTSVVLVAMQPLFVALASPLLLRERVDRRVWLALLVALAGTAVMVIEDAGDGLGTVAGDAYALLGAAFAGGYLMVGRRLRPTVSWSRYVGTVYPITAVLLLSAALIAGEPLTGYSTKTLVMIGLLALGPQLIGHNAINWSLAFLPAVLVAIAILGEPVGATAWAALVLDERPTFLEASGGLLVLAGIYLGLRHGPAEAVGVEVPASDGGRRDDGGAERDDKEVG